MTKSVQVSYGAYKAYRGAIVAAGKIVAMTAKAYSTRHQASAAARALRFSIGAV